MIAVERNKNGILRLILVNDAPNPDTMQHGKLIDRAWLMDFAEVFETILEDDSLEGIIICGEGEDFHSGLDLTEIYDIKDEAEISAYVRAMHKLSRLIETASLPVVAVLTGNALGAGLDLALSCHHIVALDDDTIELGYPDISCGVMPCFGGTQRLPRKVGIKVAADMILSGKTITPKEAKEIGLIDAVYSAEKLLDAGEAWVFGSIAKKTFQAPWDMKRFKLPDGHMRMLKNRAFFLNATSAARAKDWGHNEAAISILSSIYEGLHVGFDSGLDIERRYFVKNYGLARKLIRSHLLLPKAAISENKRGDILPYSRFDKIGIIGGGFMGAAIAKVAVDNGFSVYIIDNSDEVIGSLNEGGFDAGDDYSKLAKCGLVIEALPEDLELKRVVLAKARGCMADNAILATNTSSLPLEKLVPEHTPHLFCGLHFFSPVERVPLVEIIMGLETDDNTRCRIFDFVVDLQKYPVIVNDGAGFFTTRIFIAYIIEGLIMLEEGVKPALIENAARASGMAMSPLRLIDMVGIQHLRKILGKNEAGLDFGDLPDISIEKIEDRFYNEEGRLATWLGDKYEISENQPSSIEVENRFLYAQTIEALRVIDDGILRHDDDADLASIKGLGFPAFTGGVLSFIKDIGRKEFIEHAQKLEKEHGVAFSLPEKWLADNGDI